ncbi:MAG TPA: class I SAM-dependent methyltransferase [Candidatus Dormibacteraeota bacterium]|jgi:SAM-dependent methyltransferase|nr:class I SAM-dependent methyltransferase [Candidatus Dormibacteraeota bacterium]
MPEQHSERSHGAVFNRVATEYQRSRPAYPEELVTRACELGGLGPGDHVLEIGCGTGQLTRSLVARGLRVTAVEPGDQLIEQTRATLTDPHAVRFVHARFEDAELPRHLAAVFSAAAFHWLVPAVSWRRVADVLAPGGTLALLGHCGLAEERSRADHAGLLAALANNAPELVAGWPPLRDLDAIDAGVQARRSDIAAVWAWLGAHDVEHPDAARLFGDVKLMTVPLLLEQTADELNRLMRTTSYYQRLAPAQREGWERDNVMLHQRLGRPIRSSVLAVLVAAQRR